MIDQSNENIQTQTSQNEGTEQISIPTNKR